MEQPATNGEIKEFITGLRAIIRTSWNTQEEFAQGVTSKVNMSNILRGASGTSFAMRKALAAKAGMSIEEVIALGKTAMQRTGQTPVVAPSQEASNTEMPEDEAYLGGSASDIMNKASELTLALHTDITQCAKSMTGLLKNLIRERDKLVSLLAQEQAILDSLEESIKVVDRDMNIVYVNRSMMEKFQVTPGDLCVESGCTFCNLPKRGCIAKEVFHKCKAVHRAIKIEGEWYSMVGYPIMDPSWQVVKVVLRITRGTPWIDQLKAQGYTLQETPTD